MSLAKGINSYIGFGAEVTYGTKGTIDLFHRCVDFNLNHDKGLFLSESLTPDWHPEAYYSAGHNIGNIVFEQTYTGLELFWHSLLGTYTYTNDSPVASTDSHVFTFAPTTNAHPKLSIEGIRGLGGAIERSYLGCYPRKATVEFRPRQVVRTTFDMVGQGYSLSAATAPTFPAWAPVLPAHKSALTIGGTAFTILSGRIEIDIPRDDTREHYGETLYKEPVIIDRPSAQFSLECEFDDTIGADSEQFLVDYEAGNRIAGLVITHQGSIITGATKTKFGIAATYVQYSLATPASTGMKGTTKVTVNGMILGGLTVDFVNASNQVT